MSRLHPLRTAVTIAIILGQQIDVVHYQTVKVGQKAGRLQEAHIGQLATVEGRTSCLGAKLAVRKQVGSLEECLPPKTHLLHHKDLILHSLAHQHWMQVAQKETQMVGSISIGHDDGHSVLGPTASRAKVAAELHFRQPSFNCRHFRWFTSHYRNSTDCSKNRLEDYQLKR